jgi:drug/metabolite transporter (DMT)-like permease
MSNLSTSVSAPTTRAASDERPAESPYVRWLPLLAGLIWGTAFPAIELALRSFTPLDIAFGRGLIGALSLGTWLAARGRLRWQFSRADWARLFTLALTGAGLMWPMQASAVRLSTPVNAAFLVTIYPAILAAMAGVMGEEVRRRDWLSLTLALAGAYLIISKGILLDLFASGTLPGDLLALLTALSFAAYLLLGRRWRSDIGVASETLTLYTFALALPVLILFAAGDAPSDAPPTMLAVGALIWLGLMASTGAFLAVNRGLQSGAVSRRSIHLLIIPLVSALLSWLLFGTTLTLAQWIGGTLVLIGIAIASG